MIWKCPKYSCTCFQPKQQQQQQQQQRQKTKNKKQKQKTKNKTKTKKEFVYAKIGREKNTLSNSLSNIYYANKY